MKVLYLDCSSGISGDMLVGALCDLGVKPSTLEWELGKLELGDFHMHFERGQRCGVSGIHFSIHEGAVHTHEQDEPAHAHSHAGHAHEPHAHDDGHAHSPAHPHTAPEPHGSVHLPPQSHDLEHGDEVTPAQQRHAAEHARAEQAHARDHEDDHCCDHDHGDEHEHHHHHHHAHVHGRSHAEIRGLIEASDLAPGVKARALAVFRRIAEAEGKIHGVPAANVQFHEVGALDSIADIVCACAGLEALGVEKVFVSRLHDGHGWVDCAHGRFPLPAPATLEILRGISLGQIDEPHELITPTGAALAAEFAERFGLMPAMKTDRVGYGLGSRDLPSRPNVLRAVLGELAPEEPA